MQQYNPLAYNEYVNANLAPYTNSRQATSLPQGTIELITLQQFIGPLDQLILHKPQAIDEKWLQDKSARLQKVLASVRDRTPPVLQDGPFIQRAQAIRIEALHSLRRLSLDATITSSFERRTPQTDALPDDKRFEYSQVIRSKLGDNLLGVIAYGSSISATDLNSIGDFDNFVVVRDIQSAYEKLGSFHHRHFEKPVHVQLIPAEILPRYLAMSYSPARRPDIIKVIDGELDIPTVGRPQLALIGMIDIAINVCRLRKSLFSFIAEPKRFFDTIKCDQKAISLVAAHTVTPLANIGWLEQFVSEPDQPRLSKKDAANAALELCGLPPFNEAFLDAGRFLALQPAEVQSALATAINHTAQAALRLYKTLRF